MPDDFGIAIAAADVGKDGIFVVLCPGFSGVGAVGEALSEGFAFGFAGSSAGGGVDGDEGFFIAFLKAAGVVPVDDGGPGKHGAHCVGLESVVDLSPVQQ